MKSIYAGILLMLLSAFSFALMQVLVAMTADTIPLFSQIFFRNFVAVIVSFIILKKKKVKMFGKPENRKTLIFRCICGYIGMVLVFYATRLGNQGDVALLTKLSPFVVIIISMIVFREKLSKFQWTALILAFTGAYITANPAYNTDILPALAGVLSSVFAGGAYAFVSFLKGKEIPEVIVFCFASFSTVCSGILMIPEFTLPTLSDFLFLIGISITAYIGQMTITYSYSLANASEVSIVNYSGIFFSMFLGWSLLGQAVKITTLFGCILIIVSAILVLIDKKRKQ